MTRNHDRDGRYSEETISDEKRVRVSPLKGRLSEGETIKKITEESRIGEIVGASERLQENLNLGSERLQENLTQSERLQENHKERRKTVCFYCKNEAFFCFEKKMKYVSALFLLFLEVTCEKFICFSK